MPELYNEALLRELVNIIRNTSASHKPGIPDCMRYLFGDKFDGFQCPDTYLYQVYNDGACLPIEAMEAIRTSVNWDARRLRENFPKSEISVLTLAKNIRPLYNKFITDSDQEKGLSSLIKSLMHLYFFGTTDAPPLFDLYVKRNVKGYVPPEDYLNAAKSILEKNNVLILTGAPGMGKTELAKQLVAQSCAPYKDIGWLEVPYDATHISDCFESIRFYNQNDTVRENEILRWLERKPKTSYLIINAPALYDDDFRFIEDYLCALRIRIIITTRTPVIPCCKSSKLALENYTDNFLAKIFQKIYPRDFFSKEECSKLFDIVCRNPYVITLIAKSIRQHPEAIKKSDLLDKEQWLWHKKRLPKIHSSYNDPGSKPELPLLTLTSRILDNYPSAFLINTASRLSIWARHEIELDCLKQNFSQYDIDTAIQNGILQFTDEAQETVLMPALLADTVWFNYPIDYSDYKNEICQFLSEICIGQQPMIPIDTLYCLIENMVYRFHFNIAYLKARPSAGEKKQFFDWNTFLMQIILYLSALGNSNLAGRFCKRLFLTKQGKNTSTVGFINNEDLVKELLAELSGLQQTDSLEGMLSNMPLILTKYLASIDKMQKSKKIDASALILDILIQNIKEIADTLIRDEKNIAIDILTGNVKLSEYLASCALPALSQCAHALSQYPLENRYYLMIYNFIKALHFDASCFRDGVAFYEMIRTDSSIYAGNEIIFKSYLQRFYYTLMMYYKTPIKFPADFPQNMIQSFENIYEAYQDRLWSWDTSFLIYNCSCLLDAFILNWTKDIDVGKHVQEIINAVKKNFEKIVQDQMTLPNSYRDELLQKLTSLFPISD